MKGKSSSKPAALKKWPKYTADAVRYAMFVAKIGMIWWLSKLWYHYNNPSPSVVEIKVTDKAAYLRNVTCQTRLHKNNCARLVIDGLFEEADINSLLHVANKGMVIRPALGGPTILDLNTGFLRDTTGLVNLFTTEEFAGTFEQKDFDLYDRMIRRLKHYVGSSFGVNNIYFTAPTFITRLDGRGSWSPKSAHDEYWHLHADMNNTAHYHYSGLLYMSTHGTDFTGGVYNKMN